MKAAVVREHGGPDRLVFETNFPDPTPGEALPEKTVTQPRAPKSKSPPPPVIPK